MKEAIEAAFSDNEGNHLLVALDFCDIDYKQNSLHIPEEFCDVDIVDISITKSHPGHPIHPVVFFYMSQWLLEQFNMLPGAIFTYICSTDELPQGHPGKLPQQYRWELFDRLFQRLQPGDNIKIQDIIIGPEGYLTYGRAFYRSRHAPIIHIIAAYLQDKQREYEMYS